MAKLKLMLDEIGRYDRNYIVNADIEKTVEYLWQKYRFEIPTVHFDKKIIVDEGESGTDTRAGVPAPHGQIPEEGAEKVGCRWPATKGASDFRGLVVPLKRYPDTNPASLNRCRDTKLASLGRCSRDGIEGCQTKIPRGDTSGESHS